MRWEVKRVSGKGFMKDISVAAYKDLDRWQIEDIKTIHKFRYMGDIMEFLSTDHLVEKGKKNGAEFSDEDIDSLETCWEGKPLSVGTVYCYTMPDPESGKEAASSVEGLKKAFQMKVEDKVVQAEGDKLFRAGGATAEARRNVAQSEKSDGGVWGVKRKGPPRF